MSLVRFLRDTKLQCRIFSKAMTFIDHLTF